MTAEFAADAREKLIAVLRDVAMSDGDRLADWLVALTEDAGETDLRLLADAILAAFPQIAAPAQTTKEEAREQVMALVTRLIRSDPTFPLFDEIMAVVAAAEARVREECAQFVQAWCEENGWPGNLAAAIRAGGGR